MDDPEERVRAIAVTIPAGDVMTYGAIGQIAGLHPRHVGQIVSRIGDQIPWWRVVHADGTPASCHDGRAAVILASENVPFNGPRIDWRTLRGQP